MTPAQTELLKKEKQLAAAKTWRAALISVRAQLQLMLDALPRRRDRSYHHTADELASALRSVEIGLEREQGVAFDVLQPIVNKPGLLATERSIKNLEAECAELRDYVKVWPTKDTKNKFRYTGKPGKMSIADRYVEPGEEVWLSATQFEAMHDRFEPV